MAIGEGSSVECSLPPTANLPDSLSVSRMAQLLTGWQREGRKHSVAHDLPTVNFPKEGPPPLLWSPDSPAERPLEGKERTRSNPPAKQRKPQ